jgi:anti-sigma B factor antagonist
VDDSRRGPGEVGDTAVTMPDDPTLEIAEDTEGPRRVLRVVGELDLATAPVLRHRLHEAIEAGHTDVVVDLPRLTFMDSTGISVLVDALKQVHRLKGRLVLRNPTEGIRRVLEIAGLLSIFGLDAEDGTPA